jgi:hypothetical protein
MEDRLNSSFSAALVSAGKTRYDFVSVKGGPESALGDVQVTHGFFTLVIGD